MLDENACMATSSTSEAIQAVAAELKRHEKQDEVIHSREKEVAMSEPVNVYTNGGLGGAMGNVDGFGGTMGGLLIGALLGRGGFGFGAGAEAASHGSVEDCIMNNQNLGTIMGGITNATNAITSGQRQDLGTIMSGQQAILAGVNNDTLTTNLALCNQGDRLSTLIGEQSGSIRAEISLLKQQSSNEFAALQLQSANNTFELSKQMCQDQAATQASFAAAALQACEDRNALQMQIAECCCSLQQAVAGVTAAAVKDELDELRLQRALAANGAANGQVINQIAVSLGAITQTLAALQAKVPA